MLESIKAGEGAFDPAIRFIEARDTSTHLSNTYPKSDFTFPSYWNDPTGLDRYKICDFSPRLGKWICKILVDIACSGNGVAVCCQKEEHDCVMKQESECTDYKDKVVEYHAKYLVCISTKKK